MLEYALVFPAHLRIPNIGFFVLHNVESRLNEENVGQSE